jgi:hypothetical protein
MASFVEHQFISYEEYDIPKNHITTEHKYSKEVYKEKIIKSAKENSIEIDNLNRLPERMKMYNGYDIYESIIYFVENQYGRNKLIAFTKSLQTQDMNQSIMTYFNISEEHFMNEWKEYYSLK